MLRRPGSSLSNPPRPSGKRRSYDLPLRRDSPIRSRDDFWFEWSKERHGSRVTNRTVVDKLACVPLPAALH